MKTILFSLLAAMLSLSPGEAAVTLVFDNPNQTGTPGQTLRFTGTIFNSGASDVWANSNSINLASITPTAFTLVDLFSFPIIPPGQDTGSIDLFEYTITDPFPDPFDTYFGSYTLLGGIDIDSSEILTNADFSITVAPASAGVPEPSTFLLVVAGLGAWATVRRIRPTAASETPARD